MGDLAQTPRGVAAAADALFRDQRGFKVRMQRLRPYICPFERLICHIPDRAHVLDVGCGAGLFLGLAARTGRGISGIGFDADPAAIKIARAMARKAGIENAVRFERRSVEQKYPTGPFDVIAMIDVMHHIPRAAQRGVFAKVAERLRPGGMFLYKDISSDDLLRATANRCHDLVFARQWIAYLPRRQARQAAAASGFVERRFERVNRLWYGHDLHEFIKERGDAARRG